jgi:hypothetical protein
MRSITFDSMIGGIAVFRKATDDSFALLDELKHVALKKDIRRPWSLEFIQSLHPVSSYRPESVSERLRVGYQLAFLARCAPGDYGVSTSVTDEELALAEALIADRGDGRLLRLEPNLERLERCRIVIAPIGEVAALVKHLVPGGVMIGTSRLEPTYDNAISERRVLLASGLEACGWSGTTHWGIRSPHYLSMDAILDRINSDMQ